MHGASQMLLKEEFSQPLGSAPRRPSEATGWAGAGAQREGGSRFIPKDQTQLPCSGKACPEQAQAREHDGAEGTGTETPSRPASQLVPTAHIPRHCTPSTCSSPTTAS